MSRTQLTMRTDYDEEDDGFAFTRVKKKKQKQQPTDPQRPEPLEESTRAQRQPAALDGGEAKNMPTTNGSTVEPAKKRQKRMSFSTPKTKPNQPVRRSKRISAEHEQQIASPLPKTKGKEGPPKPQAESATQPLPEKAAEVVRVPDLEASHEPLQDDGDSEHAATKISLPFADTPVIRRNKAMRENKSGKGERRSSLSLRGQRASSLIESGSSNGKSAAGATRYRKLINLALPHNEVEVSDFYKHIEADGLPEPRRMRQLLTWCATRFLDPKPMGADFENSSAISAARVIQEELLKDLGNKSELSDWFGREDVPAPAIEIPERPNPKNLQNAAKITELEEQIRKLQGERDALEILLQPPQISDVPAMAASGLDEGLLSEQEASMLESLHAGTSTQSDVSKRLNAIHASLGPGVDAFADAVHKIGQFRTAAEGLTGRSLAICSEKLAEREREGRRKALQGDDKSPRRDLGSVLRGLSRVDR